MLRKNLPNSVKDVDSAQGVVCGYASSFNVVDDGNDMVLPGAFTKTIAEQGPASRQPRIKFLYQHDSTAILGVPQILREDGFGLYFEAKIAQTTLGRDVLALYEAGIITEHSIGYETVDADWDRNRAVRLLKALRLYEFSGVTWGMNAETPTVAVKSLRDPSHLTALATKAARLDDLLHNGSLHSDALCGTLERELKALRSALAPVAAPEGASTPYTITGVLDSLSDLTSRLSGDHNHHNHSDNKGATMKTRLVKGSGGDVAVSEDGTHATYTGTHDHGHKAFDSQGGDATHNHTHTHEGDAKHDHLHDEKDAAPVVARKLASVDFASAYAAVSADDSLQDEWGDSFQALVNALWYTMLMGDMPGDSGAQESADTILQQFSAAMSDLVGRSLQAQFCPQLDYDGDSFYDPDGPNADEDDDYGECASDTWKSTPAAYEAKISHARKRGARAPQAMPDAPALLRKVGRAISGANRETITGALDGMAKAMGDMQMHHKSIADLMTKTDPDAVRQDEDNTQGDDDTANGGTNPQSKSLAGNGRTAPQTHPAPERPASRGQAATTHTPGDDDASALLADLDSVVSRLKATASAAAGRAR